MPEVKPRFEWGQVLETPVHALVAERAFGPFLDQRRNENRQVWFDRRSWRLGFYFGHGDTRLWVPRRSRRVTDCERLVINFAHPLGRKALRVLGLAYAIGFIGL